MAVSITAGSGTSIATETVGSDQVQDVKVMFGASGTGTRPEHLVGSGFPVQHAPVSHLHIVTAASANATSVKASAGKLRGVWVDNTSDYWIYVKFHDTASTPTPGTGVVLTVGVPGYATLTRELPGAKLFTSGIGLTVVKGNADANTTAVASADATIEVFYE